MKLFRTDQIKLLDSKTIAYEPISSVDLMERAALQLFGWFANNIDTSNKVQVFCGSGNNGGDGLALARMLLCCGYWVEVHLVENAQISTDCATNLHRLQTAGVEIHIIRNSDDFPIISNSNIVVDALFGSGLSRPITGIYAQLIDLINGSNAKVIAIDIPSGLFGEDNPTTNRNTAIKANICLTLEQPKLSFLMPENEQFVQQWASIPIGINEKSKAETPTPYYYTQITDVAQMLPNRSTFAHKGTFGHLLVVGGCFGMLGAAQLCTKSALRSGVGLVTAHIPACGMEIFQQNIPEAIVSVDCSQTEFTHINSVEKYSAICVGPGLGTSAKTTSALKELLCGCKVPVVIDADALNIISANTELWNYVPKDSVITPHVKEFDRLFGPSITSFERLQKAVEMAQEHHINIVLKGAYSRVVTPNGNVHFNSTGNAGMSTGGSGDVLAGIIGGLLAQGINPSNAAIAGTFIHGLSGDLASEKMGQIALISSDITNFVPQAFYAIRDLQCAK